jgi:hypothetical protein
VHADDAPVSSRHVKVAGVALAWNVNVAVVLVVPAGGALSMSVSGGFAALAGAAPRTAVATTAASVPPTSRRA